MKNNFNIIIPTIFFGLTIFSCNQTANRRPHDVSENSTVRNNANDTTSLNENKVTTPKPDFDVTKFISLTDSLLSSIQGKSVSITYKIDTITADKTDKRSFFQALYPADNTVIKRYSFEPGKGNRELRIWFIDATYQDTVSANKAFAELHRQSGKIDIKNDFSPGLTYTNDYVIKADKKIFWLNSGCSFAFFNHQKIKQYLIKSLQIDNIQDSIWCKCGQPECSL